jgi:hypothetical protein
MKQKTRKLLSLFLSLALLCGMLPSALADNENDEGVQDEPKSANSVAINSITSVDEVDDTLFATTTTYTIKGGSLSDFKTTNESNFLGWTTNDNKPNAHDETHTDIVIVDYEYVNSSVVKSSGTEITGLCSSSVYVIERCNTCKSVRVTRIDNLKASDGKTPVISHTPNSSGYVKGNNGTHSYVCANCGLTQSSIPCTPSSSSNVTISSTSHSFTCQYCGNSVDALHTFGNFEGISTTQHKMSCIVCGYEATANHSGTGECTDNCGYNSNLEVRFILNGESSDKTAPHTSTNQSESIQYGGELALSAQAYIYGGETDVSSDFDISYAWTDSKASAEDNNNTLSPGYTDSTNYFNSYQSRGTYAVHCYVTATPKDTASETVRNNGTVSGTANWSVSITSDSSVSATVYTPNTLSFNSVDDQGAASLMEQIYNAIHQESTDPYLVYLELVDSNYFSQTAKNKLSITDRKTSDGTPKKYYYDAGDIPASELTDKSGVAMADLVFTPDDSVDEDESYNIYFWAATRSEGKTTTQSKLICVTITVKDGGSGLGILHTATAGANVVLDSSRFEQFWLDNYEDGTLQYVTFTSASNGNLYNNYAAGSKEWKNVVSQSTLCYLDPQTNQTGLDDLTYVPKNSDVVSATINFTATGKTGITANATASRSGVVTILYSKNAVDSIDYAITSGEATLMNATDFDSIYKAVVTSTTTSSSSSTTPSYKIQFLGVPTNGTLYANYTKNTTNGKVTGIALTTRNVNAFEFTNRATGSSGIGKVAYVPSSTGASDTLTYAVFKTDGTLQYIGTVNLGVKSTTLSVSYTTGATGVSFKASDFYNTTATSSDGTTTTLSATQLISFTLPTSGTLYRGGNTPVAASDKFAATADTANGVYSINDVTYVPDVASGSVQIAFTAQALAGGSKATGTVYITISGKTFSDVSTSHWAYSYISRLASEGVIDGYPDGTFGPNNAVTYGQALKMILLAAGYPTQTEPSGSNWASNYIRLAYSYGIITNSNLEASAVVTRDEIAEIAAKALNLQPATSVTTGNAPSDSTNGYVYALYNAGIVEGNNGKWYGSSSFVRMELATVICRILDYVAN